MRIRFGYVAMALELQDCSPSKAVTATNLAKIEDEEARIIKLRKTASENLENTLRILKYNLAHDIKVYRLTSKLIPLATHPMAEDWDYMDDLKAEFKAVGDFIKENDLRISSHPDHFTLLNSPREDVHNASIKDLDYHENMYLAMGLDNKAKLVMHTGGYYKDKDQSIERLINNFKELRQGLKDRIILENDDKIYNAEDVLGICKLLKVPMVLDVHHERCNKSSRDIGEYIEEIFNTWEGAGLPPKIHLSSPREGKDMRHHADYIEKEDLLEFLYKAREVGRDFDIMIEAKQKSLALHKLMEDIKDVKGIQVINGAEILY